MLKHLDVVVELLRRADYDRANAYAERFVLTARTEVTEVTDRRLNFSERHLRRTLDEYAHHYNGRRPHRALRIPPPRPRSIGRWPDP
jgi:transposase InsO family protein